MPGDMVFLTKKNLFVLLSKELYLFNGITRNKRDS